MARAMRLVDVMGRNLRPFGDELDQHHATVMADANVELMLLAISRQRSLQDRLDVIGDMRDQLRAYGDQLSVIHDNIDAALALKDKTLEAARGADQLHKCCFRQRSRINSCRWAWNSTRSSMRCKA